MIVEKIMKRDVVTLSRTDTIEEAIKRMRTFHIKHLPVINERGTVIGIVTDRDVKTASPSIFAQNRSNEDLKKPVELIMSKEVITGHPLDFAEEILDSSTAKRIESAVSAETRHQLFTKGYDGNTIYVPSTAIVVRVDDSPSCKNWEVDVHESVHVSQFILEYKYGKYSLESGSVQETQSEIVERYCGILKQLRSKVHQHTR